MQGAANVLNEFLSQGVIVQESDGAFTIPSANYSINQSGSSAAKIQYLNARKTNIIFGDSR